MTTLKKAIDEIDSVMGRLTLAELRIVLRSFALVKRLSKANAAEDIGEYVSEARKIAKRAGWSIR